MFSKYRIQELDRQPSPGPSTKIWLKTLGDKGVYTPGGISWNAPEGRFLPFRHIGGWPARAMIVVQEGLQIARQAGLMENNHVVQALAANGADHPFDVRPLPGRTRG